MDKRLFRLSRLFLPNPSKQSNWHHRLFWTVIVSFGYGTAPEVFILIARRQGFDVDRRRTGREVEVADQIDIAPGDGRCAFENLDGFQVVCGQLLLV
jgi:hypothetical protein